MVEAAAAATKMVPVKMPDVGVGEPELVLEEGQEGSEALAQQGEAILRHHGQADDDERVVGRAGEPLPARRCFWRSYMVRGAPRYPLGPAGPLSLSKRTDSKPA